MTYIDAFTFGMLLDDDHANYEQAWAEADRDMQKHVDSDFQSYVSAIHSLLPELDDDAVDQLAIDLLIGNCNCPIPIETVRSIQLMVKQC